MGRSEAGMSVSLESGALPPPGSVSPRANTLKILKLARSRTNRNFSG